MACCLTEVEEESAREVVNDPRFCDEQELAEVTCKICRECACTPEGTLMKSADVRARRDAR